MPIFHDDGPTIGWDFGGVHVKAAHVVGGRVHEAAQVPCRLWRGLPALDESYAALPDWAREPANHAVTMTGELTDCFASRETGVAELAGWAARNLRGEVVVYAGRSGFTTTASAQAMSRDVASANWHASAALVGRSVRSALMIDVGSTTTDLIPIVDGEPRTVGYSDAERLATGELVYSGVVRTPLLALSNWAPWAGVRSATMAETFASTADIYRLVGDLAEGVDQQMTMDAKGKSIAESETRLARMVGRDREEGDATAWRALAAFFAEAQLRAIVDAAGTILSRPDLDAEAPVVVCGSGSFLADRVAQRLERRSVQFSDLLDLDCAADQPRWVSTCGPAVAVGVLAAMR